MTVMTQGVGRCKYPMPEGNGRCGYLFAQLGLGGALIWVMHYPPAADLNLSFVEHLDGLDAHQVGQLARLEVVLIRHVGERLLATADGLEHGDADARAVELADRVLVRAVIGRVRDQISRPHDRERLALQAKRGHDLRQVLHEQLVLQIGVLGLVGTVKSVRRAGAQHRRDATLRWLLVDQLEARRPRRQHAHLALHDARAEALVDHLTTRLLAARQVRTRTLRRPRVALAARTAVDAPLDELAHGVELLVVVVGLHHVEHVAIFERRVTVVGAVLLFLELDDPDALARRATVLLDHARLVRHRLLEARDERVIVVVRERVRQAAVEVGDLAQRVLGAHLDLDVGARPHGDAQCDAVAHQAIEGGLVLATELAGVDADDQCVVALDGLGELGVLGVKVLDDVAGATRLDHAVRDRDGVDAVAVGALVGATVLGSRDLKLHDAQLVLGLSRGLAKGVVARLSSGGFYGGSGGLRGSGRRRGSGGRGLLFWL
mmetsp:Transcript_32206/g.72656  ORF Transcript_32206/g.72656 Transcript_32206/m.72656 type:complete len:490 (-) Transcript_32206:43-1512(-)